MRMLRASAVVVIGLGWLGSMGCDLGPPAATKQEPRIDSAKAFLASQKAAKGLSVARSPKKTRAAKRVVTGAVKPSISEPSGDGKAYLADYGNGLVEYDGARFKVVKQLKATNNAAAGPAGSVLFSDRVEVFQYDPATGQTTSKGKTSFEIAALSATASGTIFALGKGSFAVHRGAGFQALKALPEGLSSLSGSFVDTGGSVWISAVVGVGRYDGSTKVWETLTVPGVVNVKAVVPLQGGRLWFRSHKGGRMVGPGGTWVETNKPTGSALWVAAGANNTVHVTGTRESRVIDVSSGDVVRWKKGASGFRVSPHDMDADGRGRTWIVGSGGLAVLPASSASPVQSFGTAALSAAGLPGSPWFRSVYVRGDGPKTVTP